MEGEFEILRTPEDACQLAVPTTITGTVTLTIDFVEGTAEGRIEGTGRGEQGIPPSCTGRDGIDVYHAETIFCSSNSSPAATKELAAAASRTPLLPRPNRRLW